MHNPDDGEDGNGDDKKKKEGSVVSLCSTQSHCAVVHRSRDSCSCGKHPRRLLSAKACLVVKVDCFDCPNTSCRRCKNMFEKFSVHSVHAKRAHCQ
jgi:hypothetical protein